MAKDVLAHYLDHYAEAVPFDTQPPPAARYVVVIPAFDEQVDRIPLSKRPDVLTIVVANAPDDLARSDPKVERTRRLVLDLQNFDNVLVIDRVDPPIPRRQGVGLARKIGCDVAARLIHAGAIQHPVIFSTDADVSLPPGYFAATHDVDLPITWVFPFHHQAVDPTLARPSLLYDAHMRYYVHALDAIDSPYAYHSLGSLIAVHVASYAAVRGFPKRNAGEDFYLLNKLAKVAPIKRLTAPLITIDARTSHRVPFGTGPAIERLRNEADEESFGSYHPSTFELVESLYAAAHERVVPVGSALAELIDSLGYRETLTRLFASPDPSLRHFHTFFDGFKTMKLVRAARALYPDVELKPTLTRLFPGARDPWRALRDHDNARGGLVGIPHRIEPR